MRSVGFTENKKQLVSTSSTSFPPYSKTSLNHFNVTDFLLQREWALEEFIVVTNRGTFYKALSAQHMPNILYPLFYYLQKNY